MNYVELTLSNGEKVKVYPVPPFVINAITNRYTPPEVPTRPVNQEVAIPGVTQDVPDDQNPDYLRKRDEWRLAVGEAYMNARLVYGLRDVSVPASWPSETEKGYWEYLGIQVDIPENPVGKRLAYIKNTLLASGQDMDAVLLAVDSFSRDFSKEEIDQMIDSFRDQRARNSN